MGPHVLEVAMKHESEEVPPFRCGFYVVDVDATAVGERNGNEFLRGCLECAEVGWEGGTDRRPVASFIPLAPRKFE